MFDLAIIHAPRRVDYISATLENLFTEFPGIKPHVFCEPGSEWFVNGYRVIKHVNKVQYGPFFNWLKAILTFRKSENPWLIICEDDIEWKKGSGELFREYLAKITSDSSIGLVSGYCSVVNANPKKPGFTLAKISPYGWCGMLAVAIRTQDIDSIITHPYTLCEKEGKHLDNIVGRVILDLGKQIISHVPTLVYHLGGIHSTLVPEGHKGLTNKVRRAYDYSLDPTII